MGKTQLQYGSQGDEVKELQKLLNQNGANLGVDGIFGEKTLAAVKNYQKSVGLGTDGIVGVKTWGALGSGTSNNASTSSGSTTSTPTVSKPTYTAPTYKESDIVTQAKSALDAQLAQKPGAYQSQWQTQLDDVINKILNREKFSYDLNGDALYQQYKDKYIQQGKMAMGDAIGQASAMTGGYGNSYAQSVGQQAYQAQLQNLNDIIPELYQMARDNYNQEGQDLYNQYSLLGTEEDRLYGQHRDKVADWLTERDYLASRYDAERDYDYSKFADDRNFSYGQYRDSVSDDQWQTALDYQKERDDVADQQWQDEYDAKYGDVGTTYVPNSPGGNTPADDNNGGSGISTSDIKAMQKIIGVGQDGIWGSKSTAAAGGLTVEEAYKAYQNGTLKKSNTVDPNSSAIKSFQSKLNPESYHDTIARHKYGPYTAYVALKILEDKNLDDDERAYLFSYYGVTESDEQYLKDKGLLK